MKIDWGDALEAWNPYLEDLDESRDYIEQGGYPNQDLAQAVYVNGKYTVDVGWYPRAKGGEGFRVVVIGPAGWDQPEWRKNADTLVELKDVIREAVEIVGGFRDKA